MAREKHVFPTDEIAHLWAHQTQTEARNPHGNFYFNDKTIYSYGSHFPIARHVTNDKGEAAILFTNRSYSSTTAKHIHIVRQAIPRGIPVFYVHNPEHDIKGEYRTQRIDVEALIKKLQAARPDNRYEYKVKTAKGKFNTRVRNNWGDNGEGDTVTEVEGITGRNIGAHVTRGTYWDTRGTYWGLSVLNGDNAGIAIDSYLSKAEARIMLDILDSIKTWDVSTKEKRERLAKKVSKARETAKEFASISRNPGTLTKLFGELRTKVFAVNALGDFFGYGPAIEIPADLDYLAAISMEHDSRVEMARATANATRSARWQEAEARREKQAEEDRRTFAEKLPRWLEGAHVELGRAVYETGTSYLRVKDNEVQTSQGARVPLEHVKKALPLVLAYVQNGREYHRNGHTIHLGHYAIDSIDAQGNLRAGCHLFDKAEIERFAGVLGALPAEPEVAPIPPVQTEGEGSRA